jgi:hypothetical protein
MQTVDHKLVELALERIDGTSFEGFAQSFMAAVIGRDFVPLGGTSDGGADGLFEMQGGKANRFMQASIQEDHRAKVRGSIQRLRAVGREPQHLIYCTSRIVPRLDQEDEALSSETGVEVRIRDGRYIVAHVNETLQTTRVIQRTAGT